MRLIAQAAGVHLWMDTAAGLPVNASCPCNAHVPRAPNASSGRAMAAAAVCCVQAVDGIELSGSVVVLRGGGAAAAAHRRVVVLPPRAGSDGGWDVRNETGAAVCEGCRGFSYALGPGDTAMFTLTLSAPRSSYES